MRPLALLLAPLALVAADKPNIILILADDRGYETSGANGGTFPEKQSLTT